MNNLEDNIPNLQSLVDEDKKRFIDEVTKTIGETLLKTFYALGLKTHIEVMFVNDATKEEFVLTFQKVVNGRLAISQYKSLAEAQRELILKIKTYALYEVNDTLCSEAKKLLAEISDLNARIAQIEKELNETK